MRSAAKSVDAYLKALPPAERRVLTALRKTLRAALPAAEERIGYGIPGYYQQGPVVYFAAFPNHLSLYPMTPKLRAALGSALAKHAIKGSTLRFSVERPLSAALARKIAKWRLEQNLERQEARLLAKKQRRAR